MNWCVAIWNLYSTGKYLNGASSWQSTKITITMLSRFKWIFKKILLNKLPCQILLNVYFIQCLSVSVAVDNCQYTIFDLYTSLNSVHNFVVSSSDKYFAWATQMASNIFWTTRFVSHFWCEHNLLLPYHSRPF